MQHDYKNPIIYQAFTGMCRILKEEEGMMNKAIAIDMGVSFSIFSKLLSGKTAADRGLCDKAVYML